MTEWPEKFVYVCNASQAAIVNILPIVHAGIERIASVEILCGSPSERTRDSRLIREAVEPAKRLRSIVGRMARADGGLPPVNMFYGIPDRLDVWADRLRRICGQAEEDGLEVVYNLTGGTKPMSFGGLVGGGGSVRAVYVGGAPLRVEFLENNQQVRAPRHGELTLSQYLAAYGCREIRRKDRMATQAFYDKNRLAIDSFSFRMLRNPLDNIVSLLGATESLQGSGGYRRGEIELQKVYGTARSGRGRRPQRKRDLLGQALNELRGLPGLIFDGDQIRVTEPETARFLRGGWLEAAIYLAVRGLCEGRNDVEVGTGVALEFAADSNGPRPTGEIGEIDVAVMVSSQLHAIEAKTASFSAKKSRARGEQSLAQIEGLKRNLLGQFGSYIAVNPRETFATLRNAPGDFLTRARAAGVDLVLGRDSINSVTKAIRRLL